MWSLKMKQLTNILLPFLVTLIISGGSLAQSDNRNKSQTDRDIRIMKTILAEMFRAEIVNDSRDSDSVFRVAGRELTASDISGYYQPGYGIILSIPGNLSGSFIRIVGNDDGNAKLYFAYGNEGENGKVPVSEESVEAKTREFFQSYLSPVTYLPENERVLLVVGESPLSDSRRTSLVFTVGNSHLANSLPQAAFSIGIGDIKEFVNGKINENQFQSRVKKEEIFDEKAHQNDLSIFSTILSSAFDEEDYKLKITGNPHFIRLNDFGVFYKADLKSTFRVFIGNTNFQLSAPDIKFDFKVHADSLEDLAFDFKFDTDSIHKQVEKFRSAIDTLHFQYRIDIDSLRNKTALLRDSLYSERKELNESLRQLNEEMRKLAREQNKISAITFTPNSSSEADSVDYELELEKSLELVKNVIADYGITLKSLDEDGYLLLSLNINVKRDNFPERVNLRVKKSDISLYAKGELNRAQFLSRISEEREL